MMQDNFPWNHIIRRRAEFNLASSGRRERWNLRTAVIVFAGTLILLAFQACTTARNSSAPTPQTSAETSRETTPPPVDIMANSKLVDPADPDTGLAIEVDLQSPPEGFELAVNNTRFTPRDYSYVTGARLEPGEVRIRVTARDEGTLRTLGNGSGKATIPIEVIDPRTGKIVGARDIRVSSPMGGTVVSTSPSWRDSELTAMQKEIDELHRELDDQRERNRQLQAEALPPQISLHPTQAAVPQVTEQSTRTLVPATAGQAGTVPAVKATDYTALDTQLERVARELAGCLNVKPLQPKLCADAMKVHQPFFRELVSLRPPGPFPLLDRQTRALANGTWSRESIIQLSGELWAIDNRLKSLIGQR